MYFLPLLAHHLMSISGEAESKPVPGILTRDAQSSLVYDDRLSEIAAGKLASRSLVPTSYICGSDAHSHEVVTQVCTDANGTGIV